MRSRLRTTTPGAVAPTPWAHEGPFLGGRCKLTEVIPTAASYAVCLLQAGASPAAHLAGHSTALFAPNRVSLGVSVQPARVASSYQKRREAMQEAMQEAILRLSADGAGHGKRMSTARESSSCPSARKKLRRSTWSPRSSPPGHEKSTGRPSRNVQNLSPPGKAEWLLVRKPIGGRQLRVTAQGHRRSRPASFPQR